MAKRRNKVEVTPMGCLFSLFVTFWFMLSVIAFLYAVVIKKDIVMSLVGTFVFCSVWFFIFKKWPVYFPAKNQIVQNNYDAVPDSAVRIKIVYRDANGSLSERVVIPMRIEELKNGRSRMVAYCMLRNGQRTFYIDGIIECIDCETGELVSDVLSFLKSKAESK